MSRLIVKNLPPYLTQDRLRAYFESSDGPGGTLTDAKLVLQPNGTSRRFGFIGYRTPAEAQKAQKWFNRTFIDSSRITVDIVDGVKNAPTPRPNKRPRLDPSMAEKEHNSAGKTKIEITGPKSGSQAGSAKAGSTSQLDEFMQVMKPRPKGRSWADDLANPIMEAGPSSLKSKKTPTAIEGLTSPVEGEGQDADAEPITDMDWLKRRQKDVLDASASDKVFEQSDEEEEKEPIVKVADVPPSDPVRATISETSRLFLRNLPFTCTEAELTELFHGYGEVSQVHIPLDPATKQPKGLAYVTFAHSNDALNAYDALDKTSFQGRLLHILPAVDRRGKPSDGEIGEGGKKKSLKAEKAAQRKAGAGREFNWGMLYMNSDAVVSSIADRMNVSKADILNPESDNAAVKLALAETHIIQETKSFLESHGVDLSALSASDRPPARSDTIILVKNIPYGTSADDLRAMFEPHGTLRRVLVPPAGTIAVIEFVHADEGRKAFRAVAYRRLGNSVIYLEKGPVGMFTEDAPTTDTVTASGVKPVTAPVRTAEEVGDAADTKTEEPPLSAGTTLFVKNLAFSTTSERFAQLLRHLPGFAFARVQTKPDPARPGARLSMGYGFVGFKDVESATRALKSMEGLVIDGHALTVRWAGRGAEKEDAGKDEKSKSRTTKMIVKNVPFEATKKDIRELFSAHAQLKSVRLPRKFDHRARGFAFLDFTTRQEAERAYSTLRHTHFLGRHLVLEWADDTEVDIDELRRKAGVGFGDGAELPGKKRKIDMADGDDDLS